MKAKQVIKGLENLPCEKRRRELGLFSVEKSWGGRLITVFQVLKSGSLFTRSRGNRYKLQQERFPLDARNFFYSENNQSKEQPPQGYGGVPIAGDSQDGVGQGARSPPPSALSHGRLDHIIF